jgi:hypothetical protein
VNPGWFESLADFSVPAAVSSSQSRRSKPD